jgi:hypothetical protein
MATYLRLFRLTQKSREAITEGPARLEAAKQAVQTLLCQRGLGLFAYTEEERREQRSTHHYDASRTQESAPPQVLR